MYSEFCYAMQRFNGVSGDVSAARKRIETSVSERIQCGSLYKGLSMAKNIEVVISSLS